MKLPIYDTNAFRSFSIQDAPRRRILQALFREHAKHLTDYVARRLRDGSAPDVVQEVFAAILAGQAPLPAVDVRRTLERLVLAELAKTPPPRVCAREPIERPRPLHDPRGWREWERSLASRRDPKNDEEVGG